MQAISRGGAEIDLSSTDHTTYYDSLYVGVSGAVKITKVNGDVCTYENVPAGWMPVAATKLWKTGTDASELIAEIFRPV